MFPDMQGKAALVTGAAGVIGGAIAAALHGQGMDVMLCDRPGSALAKAVDGILSTAGNAQAPIVSSREADVADDKAVVATIEDVASTFGRLDVLVNCAAYRGMSAPATELPRNEWDAVLGVGLTGLWLMSRHAAPYLARDRGGAIINIGSTAGRLPRVGQAAYCVAKAGVEQLTRVMALELAAAGVRVNAVCPGATDTPLLAFAAAGENRTTDEMAAAIIGGDRATFRAGIPIGRLASPTDHASATLFLASAAAGHITGQVLYVDGGETML
jgi:2,3-dihydro-2,3-dihydroxybenzoate dehydrogenase